MAYAPDSFGAIHPTPTFICEFCKDSHNSKSMFLGLSICHFCEEEVRKYFKRLCKSKAEFKKNKL